jgi:tRNA(Arg) A34 adenosine deaminase TadA
MPLDDEKLLRRGFSVARRALSHGRHPFGAILVGAAGDVLLEVERPAKCQSQT